MPIDANGNTLSDPSGKSYSWDFENRLTQAVVPGAEWRNNNTFRPVAKPFPCVSLSTEPLAISIVV